MRLLNFFKKPTAREVLPIKTDPSIIMIKNRRMRETAFYAVLEETLEDMALRILSDEDLEDAARMLLEYARSRGYNIVGNTTEHAIQAIHKAARKRSWNGSEWV